jgi:hypothetical protein
MKKNIIVKTVEMMDKKIKRYNYEIRLRKKIQKAWILGQHSIPNNLK